MKKFLIFLGSIPSIITFAFVEAMKGEKCGVCGRMIFDGEGIQTRLYGSVCCKPCQELAGEGERLQWT